jgi:hypothetical protein
VIDPNDQFDPDYDAVTASGIASLPSGMSSFDDWEHLYRTERPGLVDDPLTASFPDDYGLVDYGLAEPSRSSGGWTQYDPWVD